MKVKTCVLKSVQWLAMVGLALGVSTGAAASTYPDKPIRLIVGFAPGGAADVIARSVAEKISADLGQQIVVENRTGANGNIAMTHVARAAPDGYTLHLSASPLVVSKALYETLPFDPIIDFAPISMAVRSPNVLFVGPDSPIDSIATLFEKGSQNPGSLTYAGTSPLFVLSAEVINTRTGMKMLQVPYKDVGQANIDTRAGRIDVMIDTIGTQVQSVHSKAIRPLAVLGSTRHPQLPDVPTLAESGLPGYEEDGWIGFVAPGRTPKAIIDRLNQAIVRALGSDDLRTRLNDMGFIPTPSTPEEMQARVRSDIERYIKVANEANLPKM